MINLSLIENLIQNSNLKSHSENIVDEHFDQIVNFIEQEKIKEAAGTIEKVFAKNVPDIRLIVYYFYAHFTEHGIKSFVKTFPLIKSLINDHAEILTPKNKTDKHVQSSLNWFFSHLLQRFKYYEKLHNSGKQHPVWKKSVSETSLDELNQLIEILQEFNRLFLEKWPLSPTKERILHLIKKIEDIQKIVVESQRSSLKKVEETKVEENLDKIPANLEEPEQLTAELLESDKTHEKQSEPCDFIETSLDETNVFDENIASKEAETHEKEILEDIHDQLEIQKQSPATSLPVFGNEDKKTIDEPLHLFIESLDNLSRKLKIFEALIEKRDYLRAAIVANDIDCLVENFDPLNYFPKLFSKYFSLFAKHVIALTEQYEKKDSLEVRVLKKLYRTDLEMFLDL